jgi:two-component system, LytTR family, response regulator AlgR
MKILICDDEALARARLTVLLKALAEVNADLSISIAGEAENGLQAIDFIKRQAVDVVLMDIRMPTMDGLQAAQEIAAMDAPPAVIFCTAYDQHALQAFEASAIDYLLKPVNRERLLASLRRAQKVTDADSAINQQSQVSDSKKSLRTHLTARVRGELKLIPIADVLYLLADAKYIEVHRKLDTVLIEESLIQLEEEFGARFVRIHRNCLVARDAISGIGKNSAGETLISIKGVEQRLEVSRRNLANVKKLIRQL